MSLTSSSATSQETTPVIILTGLANFPDWVQQTRLRLKGENLGQFLDTCPFIGDDALDSNTNTPVAVDVDAATDEQATLATPISNLAGHATFYYEYCVQNTV